MRAILAIPVVLALGGGAWLVKGREAPPPDFEAALLEADADVATDADALEAARLLEKAIRASPGRAVDATVLLGKVKSRALAFRTALVVGRSQEDPAVRAALLENARRGAGHAREVVAYAFYGRKGDPEVARAMAEGFLDPAASAETRASHAFALSSMLGELSEAERARVRAHAREVLASDAQDVDLRVEAVGLLDAAGEDRARLREALEKTPQRKIALSAARVLLRAGEDEKYVKGELERFASDAPDADAAAKALREILNEGRPGM
jgi:hypothetical protein